MELNLRHLRAALAVLRQGSISAAARAVHLTQPAITQGIAKLERDLGGQLFERSAAGMTPTRAALTMAPRIEAALAFIGSPRVTAAQMRAFLALSRAGSYAGAAAAANVREASLHRAVADLGVALGVTLVERQGRGVTLTRRGRQVARGFGLAGAELRAGLDELAALQGRETGRIVVGAMPLSRARLLPAAIARFYARHPTFQVAVVEGSYGELIGPLRDGEIDLAIGALRPPSPDLETRPLFDDRPVVVGRPGHPLAGTAPSLAALAAYPWTVAAPGAPLRALWAAIFAGAGVETPPTPVECGSVMTIREVLRASDLLALLSPQQIAAELAAGWLAVICEAPPSIVRTIGVTTRAGWTPTPLQRRFVAEIDAVATKLLD
jgi:LysR family transcriptional regulator of gallate degradation